MTGRFFRESRRASFVLVALAYGAAVFSAWHVLHATAGWAPWWRVAVADGVATLVVFAFSVVLDNSSVYDPYWSVAPMLIAPWLSVATAAPGVPLLRTLLVNGLVLCWGARLTWNWARGWRGLSHEDWRYADLRGTAGRGYWFVSFVGLHLMPTISVYLGCLALFPALCTGTRPVGLRDLPGLVVLAGSIALETVADEQLRAFRRSAAPGSILERGLWAWCRHPNYLGEIGVWWGLWLLGLAASPRAWWILAGPVWITALFVFISLPLIERRSRARRPGYFEHCARVPALFPRPPRTRS